MKQIIKNRKGFTLVELVVVMAIIAILVALALFAINAARQQARNTTRRSTATTGKTALEAYFSTNKIYPTGTSSVWVLLSTGGTLASYAPGFGAQNDPSGLGENNRLCYTQNGSNKYWMQLIPEGYSPYTPSNTCTTLTAAGVPEDYSVQ